MAARKAEVESFRKQRANFFKKGNEFTHKFKLKVFIQMERQDGKLFMYNSNPDLNDWPRSLEFIVRLYFE